MMRWFRANRGLGGRLALFALALQLYLSFGHIHREDIDGPEQRGAAATMALAPAADSKSGPADHSSRHAGDYCEICATISLLSTSPIAEPPLLRLPTVSRVVEHGAGIAVAAIVPRPPPFQSRAPPDA
jgi:hypothetical protein